MTAAIYAARSGKDVLILEKKTYGGQILNSSRIDNYPGNIGLDGFTFSTNLYNQVKEFGIEIKYEEVNEIIDGNIKTVITNKNKYDCKSIIIATGLEVRKLNLLKEEELIGKGVSYCATCDGAFFKDKDVAIVGGGNTAFEDGLFLSEYCNKVYLINRGEIFKAEKKLVDSFTEKNNTEIIKCANVVELIGDTSLEQIKLDNENILNVNGLFIAIGYQPNNKFNQIREKDGFIDSIENCKTNIEGIFVAGDIRYKQVRQLVTAVSDGAIAAINAVKYLQNYKAE